MYSKEPALAPRGFSIIDHGGKAAGAFSIQAPYNQPFSDLDVRELEKEKEKKVAS